MRCYPKEGIVRNTQDGVYLVNRVRGNQRTSGLAYYVNFGNNDGQEPDDYVEVSNDDYMWWENGGQGIHSFTLSSLYPSPSSSLFYPLSFFPLHYARQYMVTSKEMADIHCVPQRRSEAVRTSAPS
jgi:hypothetical protein